MKKILIIIIVTFLFNNIAKANCYDDLSWSWARNNLVTEFKFTNKGSKYIRITEIKVYASDGDKIISFKPKSWDFDKGRSKGFFVHPKKKSTTTNTNNKVLLYGKKASFECKYQKPWKSDISDIFSNSSDSISDTIDDLNPLNYFEKRKECLRRKDNADTVAIGKRIYKNCMMGN